VTSQCWLGFDQRSGREGYVSRETRIPPEIQPAEI
jgi:hypothetical protein